MLFVVLILAVFGAAAGAIGAATLGLPTLVGTLALMVAIALVTAFGTPSVERLFTYVSFLLYGVYVLFVLLALTRFGDRIAQGFAAHAPMHGWVAGGVTYASYNIVGAIVILPVLRHLTERPRCGRGRPHRRTAGDAAGGDVLRLHDGLLPADRRRDAAVGLPAAAARSARVPLPLSAHDLRRAARERHGRRARPQRAHRQCLAAPARHAARRAGPVS